MIPYNLAQTIEERAARNPSNYARLPHNARMERDTWGNIVFYFEDAPEIKAGIGSVEHAPYRWRLNDEYTRNVERVIHMVKPDLLPQVDESDVPF